MLPVTTMTPPAPRLAFIAGAIQLCLQSCSSLSSHASSIFLHAVQPALSLLLARAPPTNICLRAGHTSPRLFHTARPASHADKRHQSLQHMPLVVVTCIYDHQLCHQPLICLPAATATIIAGKQPTINMQLPSTAPTLNNASGHAFGPSTHAST